MFDNAGITVDVPRPFFTSTSVIRGLWLSYDDLSQNVYSPDIAIGGVLTFDIFNFPDLPKKQLKWTMRTILSTDEILTKWAYPD